MGFNLLHFNYLLNSIIIIIIIISLYILIQTTDQTVTDLKNYSYLIIGYLSVEFNFHNVSLLNLLEEFVEIAEIILYCYSNHHLFGFK